MLYNNLKIFNNFHCMYNYENITNNLYKYSQLYYISICCGVIFYVYKSRSNLKKFYHNNNNSEDLENTKLVKKINVYKKKI